MLHTLEAFAPKSIRICEKGTIHVTLFRRSQVVNGDGLPVRPRGDELLPGVRWVLATHAYRQPV
jgi:hypothetical protein